MLLHPLTNFENQKYYPNEPNGVYPRNLLLNKRWDIRSEGFRRLRKGRKFFDQQNFFAISIKR